MKEIEAYKSEIAAAKGMIAACAEKMISGKVFVRGGWKLLNKC